VSRTCHILRHTSSSAISERYEIRRKIGSGSFGSIFLATERSSSKERVCKVVEAETQQAYEVASREVELLSQMDHPCIAPLYEYSVDPRGHFTMILEFLPGGSAYDLLKRTTRPLAEICVGRLMHQLLGALRYCHSHGVLHRDVKPENLMLVQRLDRYGGFDSKLIDFGCAVHAEHLQAERRKRAGTPAYMAPEAVSKSLCSTAVDIWSAGVTAIQLLTRELIFGCPGPEKDRQRVFDAICSYAGAVELQDFLAGCPWWQGRSCEVLQFLESLLQVDPRQRPSAEEALASAWMLSVPAKEVHQGLAHDLAEYITAPEIVRCCLLSIAARGGGHSPEELEQLRDAFLAIDADGDGSVTKQDLEEALGGIFGFHFSSLLGFMPELDIDALLAAADLEQSGSVSFSEFIAACLYSRYASLGSLAAEAFRALDHDDDGWIHMQDISHLFRESDLAILRKLPENRPFNIDEWCSCIRRVETKGVARVTKTPRKAANSEAICAPQLFATDFFSCRVMSEDADYEDVAVF
jgi:calcium-dependent protein kinase